MSQPTKGSQPAAGQKSEEGSNSEASNRDTRRSSSNPQSRSMSGSKGGNYGQECEALQEDFQTMMDEVGSAVSRYCRRRPGVAGLALFGVGFYFGWKIKPW